MQGPRQGVHLSPQHMQQWRQLHRFVQWRKFQFRDPDTTYVYRARIEPGPPTLPTPPAEPKQRNAGFPFRGHLLKRPSSAGSSRRPSSATPTSPTHRPPHPMRTTSTTTLSTSSGRTQGSNKQDGLGGPGTGSGGQLSGSEFTLSATAMSIQPRQPTPRSLAAGKTNKQLVINMASSYPDPTKVKGDPRFLSRLGELARLEAETVRSEQAKARLMLSARSRPSSARSLKSSVTTPATSNNSKSNGYTYQSNRRTSTSVSASISRGTAAIKRQNSSPAVSAYNRSTNLSSSLTISKQLSCRDVPTRTQTRKVNGELDSVKEATSNSNSTQNLEEAKTKLNVTVDFLGVAEDGLKFQTPNSPPNVAVVVDGLGDGCKDQRSCSPPIVRIPAPPFKCSWSLGEGERDSSGGLEKHGVEARENNPEVGEGESKTSEVSRDAAVEDPLSVAVGSNQNSASNGCQNGHTHGDHSDRAVVEDDLKVTSDLGLSIDSLHLSEEDSVPEPTLSNEVPRGLASTCTVGNGVENGLPTECDVSAKTLIPGDGDDKLLAEHELDTVSEAGSTTKRAKKKGGRRLNKLTNGSLSMQVVASGSSTSLNGSKTVRNSHKTVKKSIRQHTKK